MKLCLTTCSGLLERFPAGLVEPESVTWVEPRTSSPADELQNQAARLRVSDALIADFEKRMRCEAEPEPSDDPAPAPDATETAYRLSLERIERFLLPVSGERSLPCSWQLAKDASGSIRLRLYA